METKVVLLQNSYQWRFVTGTIDRTSLAEKSARKDEKTHFWPPPISLVWLPNQRETKLTIDDIRIVKQQV